MPNIWLTIDQVLSFIYTAVILWLSGYCSRTSPYNIKE